MKQILCLLWVFFALFSGAATIFDEPVKLRVRSDLKGLGDIKANIITTASKIIVDTDKSSSLKRTADVFNFWGEKVAAVAIPGQAAQFQIPQQEIGFYSVNLYDDSKLIGTTRFSVVPPLRPLPKKRSPFGMAVHFSHTTYPPGLVPVMRAAGVSETRDDFFWSAVENPKGVLSLKNSPMKHFIIGANNFRTIGVFCYGNKFYDKFSAPHTPEGIAAWQKYVDFSVRSVPQCTDWEIWNEFNCGYLLRGAVEPSPQNYFNLVKNTADVIRKANPKARVLGCTTSMLPWKWLEEFFKLGGLKYLDVVTVHPYRWGTRGWTRPPETLYPDMLRLRQLVDKYADGRKIPIITDEVGYQNNIADTGISPEMQAVFLPRTFANILRAGVERGHWYVFLQHARERGNWRVGVFTKKRNYIPEPAYSTYAALTATLHEYEYINQAELIKDQAWQLLFRNNGQEIRQIWAGDTPVALEVHADKELVVTDIMGASRTLKPVNGKIDLLLCNTTVYLKGAVKAVTRSKDINVSIRRPACLGAPMHIDFAAPANTALDVRGKKNSSGTVELPGAERTSGNAVRATVLRNGKISGKLYFEYEVAPQLDVESMRLNKAGKAIIALTNRYPGKMLKVTGVSGTINKKPFKLSANDLPVFKGENTAEEMEIALPITDFKPYNLYKVKLQLEFDNHPPVEDTETIGYNPCFKVDNVVWDANVNEWENIPSIDLKQALQLRDVLGPHICKYSKNTGKIWVAWNEKFLYYAAEINDAKFNQIFPLWQGDSLQIGISPAKVSTGTTIELQAGWRPKYNSSILAPTVVPAGFDGAAISRYSHTRFTHKNGKTVYEIAIPWKVLPFVKGKTGTLFRSSIIVNDNNGGSYREGVLCWGDGITHGKTSKRYPVWIFENELK